MRTLILLVLVLATAMGAEPPFKQPPAFACDMAMVSGKETVTGHLAMGGPDKQRMEMKTPKGEMVMIVRKDTKQMIMLMAAEKVAMVMPLNESMVQYKDPTKDPNASFTKSGSETVNNVACDRYEWTSTSDKGTVWIDAAKQVVVRVKPGDGKSQIDFTNHQIGEQKAELFEVPAGYQTQSMGGN